MNELYYHYTGSGLDNIWLRNGYHLHDHPQYGPSVTIENLEGLHRTIGRALADKAAPLTGAELRFLRIELDLSQRRFGELMGVQAQTVAIWEKKDDAPEGVDYLVRHIYRQHIGEQSNYVEEVERLRALDQRDYQGGFCFEDGSQGWRDVQGAL